MNNRVTIKDLAKATGLSIAAVSYVLNGKEGVGAETRELVLNAAKELGYVPNYTARGLVSKSSQLIGVCSPQTEPNCRLMFDNPFYSELLSSIEYECRRENYHVIVSGADADESYLKLAQQRNLDGMIIVGTYSQKFYDEIRKANVPIVLIDTYLNTSQFHHVRIEDRQGAYMATKYLLDKGHREIAFASGVLRENGVTQLRYAGYADALRESGVVLRENYVFEGQVSFESGAEIAQQVLKKAPRVTALFCAADIIAFGAIKQFADMHVKVPDQISVMGFDNLSISRYISPAITTISQDIRLKGKTAVELIFGEINREITSPQCRVLPISLIERQSVKPVGIDK